MIPTADVIGCNCNDRCNSGILHVYCIVIEMWVTHLKLPFIQAEIKATKDSGKAVYFDLSLMILEILGILNSERLKEP